VLSTEPPPQALPNVISPPFWPAQTVRPFLSSLTPQVHHLHKPLFPIALPSSTSPPYILSARASPQPKIHSRPGILRKAKATSAHTRREHLSTRHLLATFDFVLVETAPKPIPPYSRIIRPRLSYVNRPRRLDERSRRSICRALRHPGQLSNPTCGRYHHQTDSERESLQTSAAQQPPHMITVSPAGACRRLCDPVSLYITCLAPFDPWVLQATSGRHSTEPSAGWAYNRDAASGLT
jgi:hypothetical protein